MESISKLRTLCQKPKVSDREDIGMSYQDMLSKFRLGLSIYLTWVFIRFGISANTVTIFSGIAAIIGGVCLGFNNIWIVLIGILFLEIYYLLDFCDGEIARYHKECSITGWFLDWYMLFVRDAAMFTGLAVGAYSVQSNLFVLLCGFLAVLTPILDKSIIGCGWTVIGWQRLVEKQDSQLLQYQKNMKDFKYQEKMTIDNEVKPSKIKSLIKKLLLISIYIFEHNWSTLVLFLLAVVHIVINNFLSDSFDFRPYLIIYAGVLGPSYVFIKLFIFVKRNKIENNYAKFFSYSNNVTSNDYFF